MSDQKIKRYEPDHVVSKEVQAIELAIKKGYTIDDNGNVYGTKGIIKPYNNRGYNQFYFYIGDHKGKTIKVHRFQAYKKYGRDICKPKIVVRHLDGNSQNNHPDNLELGTAKDNHADVPKDFRFKFMSPKGEDHGCSILTWDKVREIRKRLILHIKGKNSAKALAIEYNVTPSTILNVANYKTWKYDPCAELKEGK